MITSNSEVLKEVVSQLIQLPAFFGWFRAMSSLLPLIVCAFCHQSPSWPRPVLSAARMRRFAKAEFLLHPFSHESVLMPGPPLFFGSQYRSLVLLYGGEESQFTRRQGHKCQGDEVGVTPIDGKMATVLHRSSETMERELSRAVIKCARLDTARDVAGTYLLTHPQALYWFKKI
jgi:hypothetical protein